MVAPKLTNNQAKMIASLKYKKYRSQHGLFIADGLHLVEEALNSGWPIESIIFRSDSEDIIRKLKIPENLLIAAKSAQFDKISPSRSPQGILAVCRIKDWSSNIASLIKKADQLIACDNISDPGNLGTIIRTAAAFEYDAVILVGNCADIYNPKTVMSSQGAIFKIPIVEIKSIDDFIGQFSEKFELACFSGEYKMNLSSCPDLRYPLLILGGETSGISAEIEKAADYRLRIEQSDNVDSLNVAVAAGIAMYSLRYK